MAHLPRASFSSTSSSSSSSSSSILTSPDPPTLSSPRPDNPTTQSSSSSHFDRFRVLSETSLRFTHNNDRPCSAHNNALARLLLAPVPLTPSPLSYLSCFPPAANIFQSLLALLAKQCLPRTHRAVLTTVSVHPHRHHLPPLPPKEAIAVDFVRAVAEFPPRIPVELRTAFRNMYSTERIQHIALLVSFSAYYSTTARLLGLTDPSVDSSASPYDETEIIALTEPSEMSAPSSITHSRTSSSKSSLPRRLTSVKNHFLARVTHPLRLKIARHATHHLERSTWLSSIPTTRRSQDDFIRAAMGFTPEYLAELKNTSQRAPLIYLIDELLLRDSACGISTAVKNLCCYILARSAENSVLTAHSVFLANRFGADDKQLSVCTNVNLLQAMQDAITSRDFPSTADSSSSFTSSENETTAEPLPALPVKRRRRVDRFQYSEFADGFVADEAIPDSEGDESNCEQKLNDEFDGPVQAYQQKEQDVVSNCSSGQFSSSSRRSTMKNMKPFSSRQGSQFEIDDEQGSDTASNSDEEDRSANRPDDVPLQPLYLLPENPEVPEVDGLNSMSFNDFDEREEFNDEEVSITTSARQLSTGPAFLEEDEEIDLDLFSPREVSFLLLAHQVAQSSLQNSRMCSKYTKTAPGPLVTPELARLIHSQFDAESIMEMISVIGAFSFLLRWTVCFPYRPGMLEAPVRRFVQTPIAHDLCVDSVGQRTNSKHSFNLRIQTGRSFKIPRHAAAYDAV